MKKTLRVVILLSLASSASQATNFYVATTGNDSNTGTQSQPWQTIGHAANAVSPGDTVIVEDGTYVEAIWIVASGSSGNPITFQSANKWGASIAPTSGLIAGQSVINISGSNVVFENFDIAGPSDGSAWNGVNCNGNINQVGFNCQVIGNRIHHISTSACNGGAGVMNNGDGSTISGNFVYDISPPASTNCSKSHGIYWTAGDPGTIQNNIVVDVHSGYCLQFWGGPGEFSNVTITNNTFSNCGGSGSGSPLVIGCGAPAGVTYVCNNLNFNNNIFAFSPSGNSSPCIQEHNSANGNSGYSQNATLGTRTYSNDLLYNCGGAPFFQNTGSGGSLVNPVASNPQFVNYTGDQTGNYHLQSTSPAIDAGTTVGAPRTDFDGIAQTSPPTIGPLLVPGGNTTIPGPPTGLTASVH